MSASQRRKGAQWERDLAKLFAEAMPGGDVKRGIGQSRGGGAEVPDVVCPAFHVEAKVGKLPNPRAALAQAERDVESAESKLWPVAVVKDDRKAPFVTMRLDDFLDLVGEWWEMRQRP